MVYVGPLLHHSKRHNNLKLWPLSSGAMVACYPGGGARYVKHVDNPKGCDARKVTTLVR